ncbi:MAG TPA: hypothetical protein VD948_04100, partial [Rhodothermales bacterium]|nr:hypothetical protein [Rhodothermales bacterium]
IRHPVHVVEAALAGADVATMPFKVIEQLLKHPLTDIGLEKFLSDWKAYEAGLKDLTRTTSNGKKPEKAKGRAAKKA